ncbi:MAG TPA: type III pantothenate kinase [bacterium]|nr:type III pantothenate kinase [bacterium]
MLLAIDAGNTNTVLGLFEGKRLKKTWRIASTPQALTRWARRPPNNLKAVVASSVVPHLKPAIERLAKKATGRRAFFVSSKMKMPIRVRTRNPREVGQDRIVNAAAAYARWECGLIIVDLGTATTCDVVTPRGEYIGGTISPGIGIANEALHEKTALLPLVPIARPRRAVGRNTVEAIRSGVFYGYVGLIDGLVQRIRKELRFPVKVIATGGLSALVGHASRAIDSVDPNLTLKGLQRLQEWNYPF